MKYSYKFSNLCGTVYKTGNLIFTPDGNSLLSPVGNRVTCFDLVAHSSFTLDFETRSDIERITISPDGRLLLAIDVDGYAVVVNFLRRIIIHRFNFRSPVRDAKFSPDGLFLAVAVGKKMQVWKAPGLEREFSPFSLHRTYTGHYEELSCLDWSPNSQYICTGSKDLMARIYSLHPLQGYVPVTLSGHRDMLVAVCFAEEDVIYTVARDSAVYVWLWKERADISLQAVRKLKKQQSIADGEEGGEEKGEEGERYELVEQEEEEQEAEEEEDDEQEEEDGEGQQSGKKRGRKEAAAAAAAGGAGRSSSSSRKPLKKSREALQASNSDGRMRALEAREGGKGQSVKDITDVLASRKRHSVPAPFKASTEAAAEASLREKTEAGGAASSSSVGLDLSIARGEWVLGQKHILRQDSGASGGSSKIRSAALHRRSGLLILGYTSGVFALHSMPDAALVHALSIGQYDVHSCAVNAGGEWLAFGSRTMGQLLVWEWQTESYILKQQGHYQDLNAVAYSPNGQLMATGGDDGKVKVWNVSTGFCFVTFSEHSGPVTAVAFMGGRGGHGLAVLSASLDGTVRAYDLVRYRNFRTFTAPPAVVSAGAGAAGVQFLSLTTDEAGEVVCAGSMDPFAIYVWSTQTGKLLDVLSGHTGPVCSLSYSSAAGLLASASWDKTVKLWDVFKGSTVAQETYSHGSDCLAVAFRPDGQELCASTLDGQLHFWDCKRGLEMQTIEGRADAAGGRKTGDVRTAKTTAAGKCFTSLAYSADGSCILAGGRSKYICLYAVAPKLLLRKWQMSHNRSLEGMLDKLSSKGVGEGGVLGLLQLEDHHADDAAGWGKKRQDESLPGVQRGDMASKRAVKQEIRCKGLLFSPTGRAFAVASTEGLLVYSLDESLMFDPFELGEDITPEAALQALGEGHYGRALLLSLCLNEGPLIGQVLESTPVTAAGLVSMVVPLAFLQRLLDFIANKLLPVGSALNTVPLSSVAAAGGAAAAPSSSSATGAAAAAAGAGAGSSPHIEFYLIWALCLLQSHGTALKDRHSLFAGSLRSLQKALLAQREAVSKLAESNRHTLHFLSAGAAACETEEQLRSRGLQEALVFSSAVSKAAAEAAAEEGEEGLAVEDEEEDFFDAIVVQPAGAAVEEEEEQEKVEEEEPSSAAASKSSSKKEKKDKKEKKEKKGSSIPSGFVSDTVPPVKLTGGAAGKSSSSSSGGKAKAVLRDDFEAEELGLGAELEDEEELGEAVDMEEEEQEEPARKSKAGKKAMDSSAKVSSSSKKEKLQQREAPKASSSKKAGKGK